MIQQRGRTGRLPFRGERMTCVVCGATERAGPRMSSNWRAVDIDDERFYACPRELPPDGASAKAYKKAYRRLLSQCKRAMFERDAFAELLIVTRQAWADLKRNFPNDPPESHAAAVRSFVERDILPAVLADSTRDWKDVGPAAVRNVFERVLQQILAEETGQRGAGPFAHGPDGN